MPALRNRTYLLGIWLLLAIISAVLSFTHPDLFSPDELQAFFARSQHWMIPLFGLACILRILLFIPAMTFLLAGLLFLPPTTVLIVTTLCFVTASSLLYFGSQWMGLDRLFENLYPAQVERLRRAMDKHGSWIVFTWAFFPAVPTDLISYVAGTSRMNFSRFLLSVTAGQSVLAVVLCYAGADLLSRLMSP